jgi:thiol-disulfide isomerase/thioredoxin
MKKIIYTLISIVLILIFSLIFLLNFFNYKKLEFFPQKLENNKNNLVKIFNKNDIQLDSSCIYILNFGESWCIPCMKELPLLDSFKNKLNSNSKVKFIYVTKSDSLSYDSISNFASFSYQKYYKNNLWDDIIKLKLYSKNEKVIDLNYYALPMSVIINKNRITDFCIGEIDSSFENKVYNLCGQI